MSMYVTCVMVALSKGINRNRFVILGRSSFFFFDLDLDQDNELNI